MIVVFSPNVFLCCSLINLTIHSLSNLAFNSRINSFIMNLNMVRSTTCLKDILKLKKSLVQIMKIKGINLKNILKPNECPC
jgi:hypothetical protein